MRAGKGSVDVEERKCGPEKVEMKVRLVAPLKKQKARAALQ
jgi:hypothetical protein